MKQCKALELFSGSVIYFGEDTQQAPSASQAIGGGAIGASSMGTADENAEALKENTGMLDN